jgi:hypothetical protein
MRTLALLCLSMKASQWEKRGVGSRNGIGRIALLNDPHRFPIAHSTKADVRTPTPTPFLAAVLFAPLPLGPDRTFCLA